MSRFLSQKLLSLKPYVPGEQPRDKKYIKLNTNESPYPPSPKVVSAINSEEIKDLRLYSDPDLKVLTETIADYFGVDKNCVFCGNGSDEVLSFAFLAWGDKGVTFPSISYGFYPVFAQLYNLDYTTVALKKDFSLDLTDFDGKGGLIVFANPNAPTGLSAPLSSIEDLLIKNPESIVLVDEAYVDFGGESAVSLIEKYDNLIVVRTFSKSRQLAGARLGFAMANEELVSDLNRIKFSFNPYNVNRLTAIAGAEAIKDDTWFKECVSKIINTRGRLTAELRNLGFNVIESRANFVFAAHPQLPGDTLYTKLKEKGILIRRFNIKTIENYSRITIGTDNETDRLFDAIKEILQEVSK